MLTYQLERGPGAATLQGQLYALVRRDVEGGALGAGERLPSKRAIARHLGVSVVTVEAAYGQLVAEGYLEARPRSGYFAADIPRPPHTPAPTAPAAPTASALPATSAAPIFADFSGATPAAGAFPYAAWARTIRRVLADESERTLLAASGPQGSRALREALAAHLRGLRGMEVDPGQIVVGAGAQTLYHLLVQLLGRHRRFAVEDPGYPRLAATYRAEGAEVAPVALDGEGPSVAALRASGATVLHCMPSHQFPTGLVTPARRRHELLAWAAEEPGRYLVEDDYDCEFRMAGRPLPALQSSDAAERVIYLNTFTKSLGAAFRIGYMVLPPHLARAFARDLDFHACTVGALEQAALARLIASGDYERHVNRLRARCRRVRDALLAALRATPAGRAGRLAFEHVDAGLHFVLRVPGMDAAAQERLVRAALARGVRMAPLSSYALGSTDAPSLTGRFLMAYGSVREEDAAEAARVIGDECG